MSLSTLSSAQLAQVIGLVKKREALQGRLDKVNAKLNALEGGGTVAKKRGRKPGRPALAKSALKGRKRSKRLKGSILKLLKSAGSSGVTVKEISKKLKVKPGNIFSWFYTTGKKVAGLKKVGEAKYALSS